MLWKLLQRTFNGGKLDKRLGGRTDIAKYFQGASELKNFIVKRQGCITKRRGTVELANISQTTAMSNITASRMFPFSYEKTGGYVIVFLANASGSKACIFKYTGALVATKNIPYKGEDFNRIGYGQSGDNIFLAHKLYPFARLRRISEYDWSYEVVDFASLGNTSIPERPTISQLTKSGFVDSDGNQLSSGTSNRVNYRVTSLVNGVESAPSDVKGTTYYLPWPSGAAIEVEMAAESPLPDGYNIYKQMVNGDWGLIGATSVSETPSAGGKEQKVTTLPSGISGSFSKISSYFNRSSVPDSPMRTQDPGQDGRSSGGYCCKNGTFTVNYGTNGLYIGRFIIGLGWCGSTWIGGGQDSSGYDSKAYMQRIGCRANQLKAEVTFVDNSKTTLGPIAVPLPAKENYRYITQSGTGPSDSAAYQIDWVNDHSYGSKVVFEIVPRGSTEIKKVKTIKITAYTDEQCTEIATGDVSIGQAVSGSNWTYEGDVSNADDTKYWAVKDKPLIFYAAYATYYPVVNQTGNYFIDEFFTPDASLTPPNYEPKFDLEGDYPGAVAIYQQRLALANTLNQPFTFWLSCVGDFFNFNTHDSIREDDAIEYTLPALRYPDINHIVLNRDLIMFCDSGEWIISPLSGNVVSYKTISSKIQSQLGCSKEISPIVVGDDVIFLNLTNETLLAIKYSYANDGYEANDLSVLSQDIFRGNPITSIAYKQNPDSLIIVTLEDGSLASLSYMKEHEVVAWGCHKLGGNLKALAVAADGSVTDGTTDVYILASTSAGELLLLKVKEDSPLNSVKNAVSLDRMSYVTATASNFVPSGFVAVDLMTGRVLHESSQMTENREYVIGCEFEASFVSVKPEPNTSESVRFEVKNPTQMELSITDGGAFSVSQYGSSRSVSREALPTINSTNGKLEFSSRDIQLNLHGANTRDGRICIKSAGVWPLSILSLATTYQIEQANTEPRTNVGGNND